MTSNSPKVTEGGDAQVPTSTEVNLGPDDPRQYVRIATDLPNNIKMNAMSNPLMAIAATVIAICTSASSFTDGLVPLNALRHRGVDDTTIKELIEENVWHDETSDCERCLARAPRPKRGSIYIHDYLRHQRSGETVRDLRQKRAKAGAAGAEKRWAKLRAKQAEERAAEQAAREQQEAAAARAAKAGKEIEPVKDVKPLDPEKAQLLADAEKLCEYMAGLIQKNHSKGERPSVGKAWINDMRKMMEIDNFTREQLGQLILWTQKHHFWSDNIRSPLKLRKQQAEKDLYGRMLRERGELPVVGEAEQGRAKQALSVAEKLDQKYGTDTTGQGEIAA